MLSERHGRALLRLETEADQLRVAKRVAADKLSVKETERLVDQILRDKQERVGSQGSRKLIIKDLRLFTNSIRQLIGTLKESGLNVSLEEEEDEKEYQIIVTVEKPVGGENNG